VDTWCNPRERDQHRDAVRFNKAVVENVTVFLSDLNSAQSMPKLATMWI
jgi:hypothetical protein